MKNSLLKDKKREKVTQRILRLCDVASRIAIRHGPKNYTEENIQESWRYDSLAPCVSTLQHIVRNSNIKWYIGHGHVKDYQELPWNADFLAGLSRYGDITWGFREFPSVNWYGNENLIDIFKSSPFFGKFNKNANNAPNYGRYAWYSVPALYLPYTETSLSFMAGVLATGQKAEYENETYVRYNRKIVEYLSKWSIPIEFYTNGGRLAYISPIWIALFVHYMPHSLYYWQKIEKPARSEEYAAILWRLYINKYPVPDRLPYLPSRRTIYYKFESFKKLERMTVSRNLSNLDARIGQVVRQWFA